MRFPVIAGSKYAFLKLSMNETPRRVDVPAYNPVLFNNDLDAVDGKKQNIHKESTSMQQNNATQSELDYSPAEDP